MCADDIGVIQTSDELHFTLKLCDHPIIRGNLRRDDLECDHAVHHGVMGFIDAAHGTRADSVEDDIRPTIKP